MRPHSRRDTCSCGALSLCDGGGNPCQFPHHRHCCVDATSLARRLVSVWLAQQLGASATDADRQQDAQQDVSVPADPVCSHVIPIRAALDAAALWLTQQVDVCRGHTSRKEHNFHTEATTPQHDWPHNIVRPLTFSLVFNETNMPDEDIFQLRVSNWRKFYEFGLSDLLSITDRCSALSLDTGCHSLSQRACNDAGLAAVVTVVGCLWCLRWWRQCLATSCCTHCWQRPGSRSLCDQARSACTAQASDERRTSAAV